MTNKISKEAERAFKDWFVQDFSEKELQWRRARVAGDAAISAPLEAWLNAHERLFVAVCDDLPLDVNADWVAPAWDEFRAR